VPRYAAGKIMTVDVAALLNSVELKASHTLTCAMKAFISYSHHDDPLRADLNVRHNGASHRYRIAAPWGLRLLRNGFHADGGARERAPHGRI
jgi:hypothetical protein